MKDWTKERTKERMQKRKIFTTNTLTNDWSKRQEKERNLERTNVWMNEWMDEEIKERKKEREEGRKKERINEWMNKRKKERKKERKKKSVLALAVIVFSWSRRVFGNAPCYIEVKTSSTIKLIIYHTIYFVGLFINVLWLFTLSTKLERKLETVQDLTILIYKIFADFLTKGDYLTCFLQLFEYLLKL